MKRETCCVCGNMLFVECKHPKLLTTIKPAPPKRCIPPTHHPPVNKSMTSFSRSKIVKTGSSGKNFIRIEEVDPHEANVKIEEVPLTIPQFENAKSKVKISKLNIKKLVEKHSSGDKLHISPTCVSPQVSIQVKGVTKKIPQMKGNFIVVVFSLQFVGMCLFDGFMS